MKLKDIVDILGLKVLTCKDSLDREVTGVYISDLLSDVIGNSNKGELWITIQTHINIIAVATLKELSGIIITNNRMPQKEVIDKAEAESIPIMSTPMKTFEIAGKLYNLIG
ncbi:MAG: serine kinase [Nitrospirae bacterium]|nr:MAG: serine kinase [Nitrospirota bacterium]